MHNDICKKYFEKYNDVNNDNIMEFFKDNDITLELKTVTEDIIDELNFTTLISGATTPEEFINILSEKIKGYDKVEFKFNNWSQNSLLLINENLQRQETMDEALKRIRKRLQAYSKRYRTEIEERRLLAKLKAKYE